ncbi:MAG: tetratricopeptide repeat protein, partial [Gemmatimonadetes bacterium]|nr:tetratricopeptide repeat protein [Gemmatimonadota bacterium]
MARTITQDLWKRRVPQIVGIYLGVSWGVLEFVGFVVDQYVLSPHLVTLSLVVVASLLPSVLVVGYFHGEPGRQGWTRTEKVAIPLNLVALAAVLAVMFTGKDLGAATTTVTVTDEEGVATERVIPKTAFRKRIAVFFFDAAEEDTAAAWLQIGLPSAINTDLSQDYFIDVDSPPEFGDRLREAGFSELTGVPLSLQREIAEERHRDQFVRGEVALEGDQISAEIELYETASGRLMESRSFSGANILDMADQISTQLREDLGVPVLQGGEVQDLPVSEVLTGSQDAFRSFVEGVKAANVNRDFPTAIASFQSAVDQDPTFALAQYGLAQLYYLNNETQAAAQPLQAAMDHLYRIPERIRFQVKSDYYFILRQDSEKALATIEMWGDLFPDDIAAFQARIQIQTVRGDRAGILASLQRIFELDPAQRDVLLQIGALHQAMGDLEAAQQSFQSYADEFPEDHQVLTQLAGLSRLQGRLDEAVGYLDRALLLAPSDVGVIVGLGNAKRTLGDFEGAFEQFDAAMGTAGTSEERAQVHQAKAAFYRARGQMALAVQELERRMEEVAAFQPGIFATQIRLREMPGAYVRAGQAAEAAELMDDIKPEMPPPFDVLLPLGDMAIHLAEKDADAI